MAERTYGAMPKMLGRYAVACKEMMAFQYLPIKLAGGTTITREQRVAPFDALIGAACCDFVAERGLGRFVESYVYLTAKHLFQGPGGTFNRPGWHCDGFMTDDVNYIWSSRSPTIFNGSDFALTMHDQISMREMAEQAEPNYDFDYGDGALIGIDQYVVHRVQEPSEVELRTFFKLSISRDKYDLEGNSKNYMLDYDWPMRPRSVERNVPQSI
jgi:hypothetical protein